MKPVITSAMLRKRRTPREDPMSIAPQKDLREPFNDELHVEPTNKHPAFRAPQLGLKTSAAESKR